MTTSYTAIIEDNEETTLAEYAWRCSRNFLYGHGIDEPFPAKFLPGDYHEKGIAEAKQKIAEAEAWSNDEASARAVAARQKVADDAARYRAEHEAENARYAAMLAKVEAWKPPNEDLGHLRSFMLSQIALCYRPNAEPYQPTPPPEDGEAYRRMVIDMARDSIAFHEKYLAEDRANADRKNAFFGAMRAVFGEDPVTARSEARK